MSAPAEVRPTIEATWRALDGTPGTLDRLTVTGPTHALPSVFPVTTAATASVALATLALADLWSERGWVTPPLAVDSRHAALACRSERLLEVRERTLGGIWDSVSGVYAASDGWIRLHTNFPAHRRATCRALGLPDDDVEQQEVAHAVSRWKAVDLEDAIYAAGGCAGALRTRDEWADTAHSRAVESGPLIGLGACPAGDEPRVRPRPLRPDPLLTGAGGEPPVRPLAGVRVLDLTRVIAGPVAGRFLAAYGADVLRVDPPGSGDGPVPVADTTTGKRSAVIDASSASGRSTLDELVGQADVVLCAYRPGALADLGYGPGELAGLRPGVVIGSLSAYGTPGQGAEPWCGRRGFDSLVQMVTGLADEGRRMTGAEGPVPLPAQLLDHMSGYLLAAGVVVALTRRLRDADAGVEVAAREVRISLARTAGWLFGLGHGGAGDLADPPDVLPDDLAVDLHGPLGHTRHIACPGAIVGAAPRWETGPVPLGHDSPTWRTGPPN